MRLAIACAVGLASTMACRQPADCARVASHAEIAWCLGTFYLVHAPGVGAELARSLVGHDDFAPWIEVLAQEVGDTPAGADAWNALGDVRIRRDDDRAVASYQRALAHRAAGDTRGRVIDARALYRAYGAADNYKDALHYASIAYELSRTLDDRVLRGRVLTGVTALLYDIGALTAAETVMLEADKIVVEPPPSWQLAAGLTGDDEAGRIWASLGEAHGLIDLAHGRFKLAAQQLRRTLAFASQRRLTSVVHDTLLNLVDAYLATDDAEGAAGALAMDPPDPHDPESRAAHADLAARVELARGRPQGAVAMMQAAVNDAPESWQPALNATYGRALAQAGQFAAAETILLQSIALLESNRADTELDALKPWVLAQSRRPYEDLFAIYAQQGRHADALEIVQQATARSTLEGLVALAAPATTTVATQIDRAGERAAGLRALIHSLRSTAATSPLPVDKLLSALASRRVLTYFTANDQLWLIVTHAGEIDVRPLGDARVARQAVQAWLSTPGRSELAARVAALVLPPSALGGRDDVLHIAVDEAVRDLPFAALPLENGYLIERHPLSYVPSASVLAALGRVPYHHAASLVLGDPTDNLPDARREATEVAQTVQATLAVGSQASRARMLDARGLTLLHIAAHTTPTARGPALLLADGPITTGDVVDSGLGADLVVLASCSGADPGDRDELGPLAHAFVASGAHAVVASRWSVGDQTALRFSRAFYASGGRVDPVRGAALAQRRLIAEHVSASDWATFVVYGELESPLLTRRD